MTPSTRSRHLTVLLAFAGLLAAGSPAARSATLTVYSTEDAFAETAGGAPALTLESFDAFESGTVITTQVPGVIFSSPNSTLEGYLPIQAGECACTTSAPNILFGGSIPGTSISQIIVMQFSPPISAFAFQLAAQLPAATDVSILFEFTDGSTQTLFKGNANESEDDPEFFGVRSDTPIGRVSLTSGTDPEGFFEEFGIDDLQFGAHPPLCSGSPDVQEEVFGVAGTATDSGPGDTGIVSVALANGEGNVALDVCPTEGFPVSSLCFFAHPIDTGADAQDTVVATDGEGLTCTLPVSFHVLSGPTVNETVCSGEGILLSVSNEASVSGTSACSATLPAETEPDLPPGYEPSPATDPTPCRILTVDSPISGFTNMVYKKDGEFDPRLRLLFSESLDGGETFPPFTDVTERVESILNIDPDPTRMSGSVKWTPVKIACALQNEICDGVDNDGDGLVDEGLPVGEAPVNKDGDGFDLCPAPGALGDCNDQISTIYPGAPEACNGLDDDCDSLIDEGNPGGGAVCSVPGQTGACAAGVTSCVDGALACAQTVSPTSEICDGADNDCDGSSDEGVMLFSGYLQPVNTDGSSIFRRRSTIPLKFRLTDCAGNFVGGTTATLEIFFYSSGVLGSEIEDFSSAGLANTDNLFRYDAASHQYIYNLSTLALASGNSYLLRTTLVDGSKHDVVVSIR